MRQLIRGLTPRFVFFLFFIPLAGACGTRVDDGSGGVVDLDGADGEDIGLDAADVSADVHDAKGGQDGAADAGDTAEEDGAKADAADSHDSADVAPDVADAANDAADAASDSVDAASGCTSTADCNDDNPCTDDTCSNLTGCVHLPNTVTCDDGDACSVGDTCKNAACTSDSTLGCDDGNACTADACDKLLGCVSMPQDATCTDSDSCTTNDVCFGGLCVGGAAPGCDDGNACTADACDKMLGCVSTPQDATCTDSDACTTNDVCFGGLCVGGAAPGCDDGNACTADGCDKLLGCVSMPQDATCTDSDLCTTDDLCVGGSCVGGAVLACDDTNVCTTDACVNGTGCVFTPGTDGANCSDGSLCTNNDQCSAGLCVGSVAVFCAGDACHDAGTCVAATGTCTVNTKADGAACNDGDFCTTNDACASGKCVAGPAQICAVGPIHRWSFTTDGTDSIGGANATLSDAPIVSGAMQLNGTTGYATLPIGQTFPKLNSSTFETWLTWNDVGDQNWARIFDFGNDPGVNMFLTVKNFRLDEGPAVGTPRISITTDSIGGEQQANAPTALDSGVLKHVAVTLNANDHTMSLYIDGVLIKTRLNLTTSPAVMGPTVNNFLGKSQYNDPLLNGAISEFRIYNRALNAAELAQSFAAGPDADLSTNLGQCHISPACNQATGTCEGAPLPDGTVCSDGNSCTEADTCAAGDCLSGTAKVCDDNTSCTVDSCLPAMGCMNTPNAAACTDGDPCTADFCTATGTGTGCSHTFMGGPTCTPP